MYIHDICLLYLVPSLFTPLIPFFSIQAFTFSSCYQLVTLLSCCLVCLYFASFLTFAAIILLLEVTFPSYLTSCDILVSIIFLYITSKCWDTENLRWFKLSCRSVSGSLVQAPAGNSMRTRSREQLFLNFLCSPKLARVIETQLLVRVRLLVLLGYFSYPIKEFTVTLENVIYLCRKSSVKRNIWQWKNWIENIFNIKGTLIILEF